MYPLTSEGIELRLDWSFGPAVGTGAKDPDLTNAPPRSDRASFVPGSVPHQAKWEEVLRDPRFEDMVAERWMRVGIARIQFNEVGQLAGDVVELTERELDAS